MPNAKDLGVISNPESAIPRPGLFNEARRRLRLKHYSLRTEQAYLYWIRRCIESNDRRPSCSSTERGGLFQPSPKNTRIRVSSASSASSNAASFGAWPST